MRSPALFVLVILAVTMVMIELTLAQTIRRGRRNPRSCRQANLCCPGQNNTCFVFGMRMDRSESSKRCYCDSNCIIMGDCCVDYHYHCRSVDCEVGEWTEWSECDNPCGFGTRRRTRGVSVHPDNGGNNCPVLKQRRACVGYEKEICNQNLIGEQVEEKSERANILPVKFGRYRTMKKYDPWKGILKNLYNKYFNEIFTRPTYRAHFRVVSSRHGCDKSEWANVMRVNASVCVECQPVAMNREIGMRCRGHGVHKARTSWKAVDVPHCHGTWEMVDMHKPEVCEYNIEDEDARNFIFI